MSYWLSTYLELSLIDNDVLLPSDDHVSDVLRPGRYCKGEFSTRIRRRIISIAMFSRIIPPCGRFPFAGIGVWQPLYTNARCFEPGKRYFTRISFLGQNASAPFNTPQAQKRNASTLYRLLYQPIVKFS
jgi:hypothetical protein